MDHCQIKDGEMLCGHINPCPIHTEEGKELSIDMDDGLRLAREDARNVYRTLRYFNYTDEEIEILTLGEIKQILAVINRIVFKIKDSNSKNERKRK